MSPLHTVAFEEERFKRMRSVQEHTQATLAFILL